jgi:hypothetical protein
MINKNLFKLFKPMSFIEKGVFKQEKDKLNIVNFQKSQKIVQFILTVLL